MKILKVLLISVIIFLIVYIAFVFFNIVRVNLLKTMQPDDLKTIENMDEYIEQSNKDNTEQEENNIETSTIENKILDISNINVQLNEYGLELPINGATGYTSISMDLFSDENCTSIMSKLNPGTPFSIEDEKNKMWYVNASGIYGWLDSTYCMINLPDVIPSIVYDDTNSYSSIFKSNGKNLNNITSKQLYNVNFYNERFDKKEFAMPVMYAMAKKICLAQNEALKNGDCLKIYETYRPYEVQMKVSDSLTELMNNDESVYKLINKSPWDKSWFIAVTLSNHQRGIAIDTSLVKVRSAVNKKSGNYNYIEVDGFEEYNMPTQMHELSSLAATFKTPVSSKSKTDWKNAKYSSSMNSNAKLLQKYCTDNNLYPLASEWWHFNDLDAKEEVGKNDSQGKYYITKVLSHMPNKEN